jgi:hypothetical protein
MHHGLVRVMTSLQNNLLHMKSLIILVGLSFIISSCGIFRSQKNGCPTNGRNVGAEKILANDPQAIRAANHAAKFVKQ